MNRWNEFDYIKTPDDWKNIPLSKPIKAHYRLSFVIACTFILFTFTTTIAYQQEIKDWLDTRFQQENVYSVKNNHVKIDKLIMNPPFAYEGGEDKDGYEIVKDVYLVANHSLKKLEPFTYTGKYKGQTYSFQFVRSKNQIMTFDHKGYIEYSLPYIQNNFIYVMTQDNNLVKLNLSTKELKFITHDNQSINPIMSPNGKTILINKSKSYWTAYDTFTNKETRVNDISGYALSNEVKFLDDYNVITYGYDESIDDTKTYVIDLHTFIKKSYDVICERATPFVIEEKKNKVNIKNFITNKECTIPIEYEEGSIYLTEDYILLSNYKGNKHYLYSNKDNKYEEVFIPESIKENLNLEVLDDDSNELIIYNDEHLFFIDISHLFQE